MVTGTAVPVVIEVEKRCNEFGALEEVYVTVDGTCIGGGGFGGAPEDNCESRDYSWVMPLVERLVLLAARPKT